MLITECGDYLVIEVVLLAGEHVEGLVVDDVKFIVFVLLVQLLLNLLISLDVDVLLSPGHFAVDVYPPPRSLGFEFNIGDAFELTLEEPIEIVDYRVVLRLSIRGGLTRTQLDIAVSHVEECRLHVAKGQLLAPGIAHKLRGYLH